MSRRWRNAQVMIAVVTLLIANYSSADLMLPYVTFDEKAPLTPDCQRLLDEAAALLPGAQACRKNSDCHHYPCSCSAISDNEQSSRYRSLVESLQTNCGAAIIYAYCGPTEAICEHGRCETREVERDL